MQSVRTDSRAGVRRAAAGLRGGPSWRLRPNAASSGTTSKPFARPRTNWGADEPEPPGALWTALARATGSRRPDPRAALRGRVGWPAGSAGRRAWRWLALTSRLLLVACGSARLRRTSPAAVAVQPRRCSRSAVRGRSARQPTSTSTLDGDMKRVMASLPEQQSSAGHFAAAESRHC